MAARGMTKQQADEYLEAFMIYDTDNDNRVNMDEVATIVRSIGFSPTEEELKQIAQAEGAATGRTFTRDECAKIISNRVPPPEPKESLIDAFRIFDKDGNGYVSVQELRHVLTHLGEKLKDEEVDEMIREADITGDGQMNYADLCNNIVSGR